MVKASNGTLPFLVNRRDADVAEYADLRARSNGGIGTSRLIVLLVEAD